MTLSRRLVISRFAGTLSFLTFNRAAFAGSVVKVALWDKGEGSMEGVDTTMPMGMAMPGALPDMATMGITVGTVEFPAGEVTFRVVNESREFYHSMAISPVPDPAKELPYLIDSMMVDEAAAGTIARVKELRPRDSWSVTVDLPPGTYILLLQRRRALRDGHVDNRHRDRMKPARTCCSGF